MYRSLPTAMLATGVAIAALVGCGDGEPRQVSAEELIAEGNAICISEGERFTQIQAAPAGAAGEAADQTGELADVASDALGRLEDMKPPPDVAPAYSAYLESLQTAHGLLEDGADAASAGDAGEYGRLQSELSDGAPGRRKLAQAVGLDRCSALP